MAVVASLPTSKQPTGVASCIPFNEYQGKDLVASKTNEFCYAALNQCTEPVSPILIGGVV